VNSENNGKTECSDRIRLYIDYPYTSLSSEEEIELV